MVYTIERFIFILNCKFETLVLLTGIIIPTVNFLILLVKKMGHKKSLAFGKAF